MPGAVTSNAVAALKGGIEVYSLMGLGTKKTWDDITNKVYVLRFDRGSGLKGRQSRELPGDWERRRSARGDRFLFSADTD